MQVISFNTAYASPLRRLAAWIIDMLMIGLFFKLFFMQAHLFDVGFHPGALGLSKFILISLYFAAMEASSYQGTVGKIVMDIKVTDLNGMPLNFSKALLRNLSKIISGIVLCIGYILILFDSKRQGLHDKIADTIVVRK